MHATTILRGALVASALAAAPFAHAAVPFRVQGLAPFGPAHVAVAFTDSVDVATALRASSYSLVPQGGAAALGIRSVQLQDNQRTVFLVLSAALPRSATYTVGASGVRSRAGAALETGGPETFTTPAETVLGIADVHASLNDLLGQSVTLIGQVFVRPSTVSGTPSGYVQDATGRGLNVFGAPPLLADVDSLTHVVKVTGTLALYFTTVEITNYTASVVARDFPPLAPRTLTVQQASSPQWEGTYVRTTATLTGPPTASGSSHFNYPASSGGTPFTFRVRNATGINPASFAGTETVTGAGAGAVFSGVYQVTVGNAVDFGVGTGPPDVTPPVLVSAEGEGGTNTVAVTFSEPLATGGDATSSYAVYPTGSPGSPVAVTAVRLALTTATLTLAAPLEPAVSYTVAVSGVADAAGNAIPAGATIAFVSTTPVPFGIAAAFPFGATAVGVAYTHDVNASQATALANYAFTPALALAGATLQENGRTVILRTLAPLPAAASWTLAVSGVTSATGEPLPAAPPLALATGTETVLDIADLQADPSVWSGSVVTVIGQVTIPVGSRGGTPSGYVQDGSGRGVNLFGGTVQGPVNQLGSVAKVTGTVEVYFGTTEITGYTAAAIASGLPHLRAKPLTIAQANSSAWEGTYVECTGTLDAITPSGTSNTNFDASEGGAAITFRVANGLGIPASGFQVGDRVTGRGAGGSYQSTFQILVGNLDDFFLTGAGGVDTTGPAPVSATGADASGLVTAQFSEPLRSNEATLATNYALWPEASPANPITVTQAVLGAGARTVTLTLAAPLRGDVRYVLSVTGIADLAGNLCAPGARVTFTAESPAASVARLEVPARTLVRNLSRQGELMGVRIAVPPGSRAVCRVFDAQGRLVRVLWDGALTGTGRRTVTWDARDETFEFVPAGFYVCHLQATDSSGRTTEATAPIVVAVRLR